MKGNQCTGCCHNEDEKCTRIGINKEIGVCLMELSEGEY
ncbi:hypothetical protein NPD5_3854 [Clostridium sporogenes]|uniref:Uncharacterized protein n=1 Tax=Clostridium sporogenes TaxID=1509 RepID=A0A1L3NG02_CLOSG|nr:hypothetical protein NPD5_3854 [Clostridium sporogenes]